MTWHDRFDVHDLPVAFMVAATNAFVVHRHRQRVDGFALIFEARAP